jgi:hypothetical protein
MLRRSLLVCGGAALVAQPVRAQSTNLAEILATMQGVWISRYSNDDREVIVDGNKITVSKMSSNPAQQRNQAPVGTLIAVIESINYSGFRTDIPGPWYKFRGKSWGPNRTPPLMPNEICAGLGTNKAGGLLYQNMQCPSGDMFRKDVKARLCRPGGAC